MRREISDRCVLYTAKPVRFPSVLNALLLLARAGPAWQGRVPSTVSGQALNAAPKSVSVCVQCSD